MHYSTLLLALPLAHAAALVARDDVVVMQYATDINTVVVTQTAGAPVVVTETAQPVAVTQTAGAPAPSDAGNGHGHHHHPYSPPANAAPPAAYQPAPAPAPAPAPPAPAAPAPAPEVSAASAPSAPSTPAAAPSTGGADAGGCPLDNSGAHISPGVNGNADGSMIDSLNRIRRMYNPAATCLGWSQTLQDASNQCASQGNENNCCRGNAAVVSDMHYTLDGATKPDGIAKTVFEGALVMMLCQDNTDPKLGNSCGTQKTGEVAYTGSGDQTAAACSGPGCTGHRDQIIDQSGQFGFMAVGIAAGMGDQATSPKGGDYMTLSLAKNNNVFD